MPQDLARSKGDKISSQNEKLSGDISMIDFDGKISIEHALPPLNDIIINEKIDVK